MKDKKIIDRENLIVLLFAMVAITITCVLIFSSLTSEYNSSYKTIKSNVDFVDSKQVFEIDAHLKDLYIMAFAMSNGGDSSIFDECIEKLSEDFKDIDYVGLSRAGAIEKIHPEAYADLIGQDVDILNKEFIGSYISKYGVEVDYYLDEDGALSSLGKYPVYANINGEKVYYGELFYVSNLKERALSAFEGSEIYKKINCPWRISLSVESGETFVMAEHEPKKLDDSIVFSRENANLTYTFEISKDIVMTDLKSNSYIIASVIIVLLLIICLKAFLMILRKYKEIDRLNETKLDFFTNVIYEIRTSTNSILGICNEAEKSIALNEAKKPFDDTKIELRNLLHKVNNMLDITNVRWGKYDACEEEYYVHMLINEITDEYKEEMNKRELTWIVDIAENLPIKFKGARSTIKKILEHVINNSLGLIIDGHIKIGVYGKYISKKKDKINLIFVISDTGIGIKNENLKEIFEISNVNSHTKEGKIVEEARVELSIAKQLAVALGGDLKVTSEYRKGSVYTISVVQEIVDSRQMTEELLIGLEEKYRSNLGTLKKVNANVLIVDDNEVNLSVLTNIIKSYGANVDFVKKGSLAVDLAAENNYDIIFIDYLMPGMDGIDTLNAIRALGKKYKNVPAVLVTANTFGNELVFKNAGFNEYLAKPIIQSDIERCLKTLLDIELIECQEVDN